MENNIDVIAKVQNCELDILEQIDRICRKYKLEYFGIGGTALGTVRHAGFIPWDDDIDIAMPRKDYEIFLSVAENELAGGYHVQNFKEEPESPFYFTKLRKNNTRFVEYYLKDYKMHHGIFVDIFPFDNIPDKEWMAAIHFKLARFLFHIYLCKSLKTVYSEKENGAARDYRYFVRRVVHWLLTPFPKKWLFCMLDAWVRLFNGRETKRMGYVVAKKLRVARNILYPIQFLQFEKMQMPLPKDSDAYLKAQYGNYMVLPPASKRKGHLPYLVEFETGGTEA